MRFTATLELHGVTATGIAVPPDIIEALGAGKRPAVTVSFRGHTYRSTVGTMGGRAMLPVSAEHRAAAGVTAGETIDVEITLDTAPREVFIPDDLGAVLDADPARRAAFDALSSSNRRRHVLAVEGAKTDATRQKRIMAILKSLAPAP